MSKRKQTSELVEAAQAFDEALDAHARAAELFARTPLTSTKQIERANELLGEIAAAEQLLQERGAALAAAVAAARDRQQTSAQEIVARLPMIQERNALLHQLLEDFGALGTEAGALNTSAGTSSPRELIAALTSLAERASALATRARDSEFEELVSQAHALGQRLTAAAKKLQGATL